MSDILQAARSYYGLSDTESCTTQLYTNQAGQPCVAFEIALSNEDFVAIIERMQKMQQFDNPPDTAIIEGPTVEAMREAYNALSKAEKGRYGSFARYMAESSGGIAQLFNRMEDDVLNGTSDINNPRGLMASMEAEGRQVIHVDAPEEPEPVSMKAVWLDKLDCTHAQIQHASDWDGGSMRYLIQWAMLTEEQRAKHAMPEKERGVWLAYGDCTTDQLKSDPPTKKEKGEYFCLIMGKDLTDEQKQKAKESGK